MRPLNGRVCFAAQLAHSLDQPGHAAAMAGVVIAQAAAVSVYRQGADTADQLAVADKGAALARGAEADDNLMHRLIDCANAYCTVGEMVSTLKSVWGEFQQPVVF